MTVSAVATGEKITATTMNAVITDLNDWTGSTSTTTFSAASSVQLNGAFATGKAYMVTLDVTAASGSSTITARMVSGTTPNTAALYHRELVVWVTTTSTGSGAVDQTSWLISGATSRPLRMLNLTILNAAETAETAVLLAGEEHDSGYANIAKLDGSYRHESTTSFTGIQFIPSTGTITGTVTVRRLGA